MTAGLPLAAGFMLVEAGVFGGFGRHRAMPIGNSRSLTRRTPLLAFGEVPRIFRERTPTISVHQWSARLCPVTEGQLAPFA